MSNPVPQLGAALNVAPDINYNSPRDFNDKSSTPPKAPASTPAQAVSPRDAGGGAAARVASPLTVAFQTGLVAAKLNDALDNEASNEDLFPMNLPPNSVPGGAAAAAAAGRSLIPPKK